MSRRITGCEATTPSTVASSAASNQVASSSQDLTLLAEELNRKVNYFRG